MKYKILILSVFFLINGTLIAQNVSPELIGSLPSFLKESSGITFVGPGSLWSHNDSGGEPKLYEFDTLGNLIRTVYITNAVNNDWEDITSDGMGNIFIGDFGNNNHNRTDLHILKVPIPPFPVDSVQASFIQFHYPDQVSFPPSDSAKNFDMEAFFWYENQLYLFSKNWTNPYNGFTQQYSLPDEPGNYTATKKDSFYTGSGGVTLHSITAADISLDKKEMVLLSYTQIWHFTCFEGDHFFEVSPTILPIQEPGQWEAICYGQERKTYLTNEEIFTGIGGNLYELNMDVIVPELDFDFGADTFSAVDSLFLVGQLVSNENNLEWEWSTGETKDSILVESSGWYSVTITQGSCVVTDSVWVEIVPHVGASPSLPYSDFKCVVNYRGFHPVISVHSPEGFTQISFRIFDLTGREVAIFQENLGARTSIKYPFNELFPQLSSGLYSVHVSSGRDEGILTVFY